MPASLAPRLREHHAHQAEERLAAGTLWVDNDYVFSTELGTALDPANLRRTFRRIAQRAGIGDVVPYEMRHTAASLLLDQGCTVEEVADVLGDLPETIYRHYRHRVRASADAAAGPMERLFGARALSLGGQLGGNQPQDFSGDSFKSALNWACVSRGGGI